MTKEEIQAEYNKATQILGEKVYRLAIPFLECIAVGQRLMYLNNQMGEYLQKERARVSAKEEHPTNQQANDPGTDGGEKAAADGAARV